MSGDVCGYDCLGDKRRCASGCWSGQQRHNVRRNCGKNFDPNLFRWIDDTKRQQRGAEVLVQLADETVAATDFAVDG